MEIKYSLIRARVAGADELLLSSEFIASLAGRFLLMDDGFPLGGCLLFALSELRRRRAKGWMFSKKKELVS
jgi:hypothetical protein